MPTRLWRARSRCRQATPMRSPYINFGNILQAQGKLDEAVACQERALALKPDCAEAYFNLGNVRKAQGNLDEAVVCYERAVALKPSLVAAQTNLGRILYTQGKLDEASRSRQTR